MKKNRKKDIIIRIQDKKIHISDEDIRKSYVNILEKNILNYVRETKKANLKKKKKIQKSKNEIRKLLIRNKTELSKTENISKHCDNNIHMQSYQMRIIRQIIDSELKENPNTHKGYLGRIPKCRLTETKPGRPLPPVEE